MYFYEEAQRAGHPHQHHAGQQVGYPPEYDDEEAFDSDDQLNNLYTEGLAERIWDDDE